MTLRVTDLSKTFGTTKALDLLSFSVSGGVVALLGSNGSGKSTLLRILATALPPDSGTITYDGLHYGRDTRWLRQHIGFLPQDLDLPRFMSPHQLLKYLAQLKGAKRSQIDELIDTLGLSAFIHMPLSRLSGGQVRLLGIAGALLGKPSLLLLDELGRGLDFQQQKNVQSTVHKANTRLVLFSTHIPGEAEGIAERVIVLHNGKLLFCGSVDELRHKAQGRVSSVRVHPHELENYLSTYLVSRVTHNDGWVMLRVIGEPAIRSCAEEPTVEDGYLVLRQQVSEPYD